MKGWVGKEVMRVLAGVVADATVGGVLVPERLAKLLRAEAEDYADDSVRPRCDGECGSSPGAGCEAADLRAKP